MSETRRIHDAEESLTSLEPVFPLQHIVHHLVVLARVSVVDQISESSQNVSSRTGFHGKLTVAAHDGGNSSHNGSQEWMSINLVLSPIINLGCGLRPGIFLLVVNPVLGTGLHSR
jgi:hypothetical protein